MKLDWGFHIPTDGMTELSMRSGFRPNLGDCARITKFYEDAGQLHWNHGRNVQTVDGYFVQSWDQEMYFVTGSGDINMKCIEPYLDANIRSEVIKCRVPLDLSYQYETDEYGVLLFLSHFHPSDQARADAQAKLLELNPVGRFSKCEQESQPER